VISRFHYETLGSVSSRVLFVALFQFPAKKKRCCAV